MSSRHQEALAAHLKRHARTLRHIACGFGRQRDADDIVQILYTRWWQRMGREPGWEPPEEAVALFVCVKRAVLDQIAKEATARSHAARSRTRPELAPPPPDESLHALHRLEWILARMPAHLAEVLEASLAAGHRGDEALAAELRISRAAFTTRLFRARRAAEELASYYDILTPDEAHLLAEVQFSGKSRRQVAHEMSLLVDDLAGRCREALASLEARRSPKAVRTA
jgi:DNA-directed RNA polymerase specialized sigma24 family protein